MVSMPQQVGRLPDARCVIFDLDGTLVDSEPAANRALLDLLPDLEEDVGQLVVRYRGQRLAWVLADVEQRLKRSLPADFEQRYRAHADALFETELKPMPDAEGMLAALRLPRCIASSGPRAAGAKCESRDSAGS